MIKVSIIIPVYNVEKYLRECLDSIINQTLKDIEIICVNDCSTDNSLKILKEYAQKDNRIVLINLEENHGQGYCRNLALDKANGDYVMLVDSDDWLDLKACEVAYNQISQNKNDFVMFNFKRYILNKNIYKTGTNFIKIFGDKINKPNLKVSEIDSNFVKHCFSWTMIYNREFLNKNNIRYADLRFNQDNVFVFNTIVSADNFSVLDEELYFYRINTESTCYKSKHYKYFIPARMESYKLLKEKNASDKIMNMFVVYAIRSIFKWYKHFYKMNKEIQKELFYQIKDFFILLSADCNIEDLKTEIDENKAGLYKHFLQITRYGYKRYLITRFLNDLFTIEINLNSKIIFIKFLGIKIHMRTK